MFVTCVDLGDTHLESFPDLLVLPPVIYQLQQKRLVNNFDSLKRHTFLKDFKFFDPQRQSIFLILKMFFLLIHAFYGVIAILTSNDILK